MSNRPLQIVHGALLLTLFGLCAVGVAHSMKVPAVDTEPAPPVPAEKRAEAPVVAAEEPPDLLKAPAEGAVDAPAQNAPAEGQELTLLGRLRSLKFTDPEESVRLAQQLDERFPESAHAPERAWYQARNLVYLERFEEARELAREVSERFPADPWSLDLTKHLLSHPFGLPPRDH